MDFFVFPLFLSSYQLGIAGDVYETEYIGCFSYYRTGKVDTFTSRLLDIHSKMIDINKKEVDFSSSVYCLNYDDN